MSRPTPEQVAQRRKEREAVNNLNRGAGAGADIGTGGQPEERALAGRGAQIEQPSGAVGSGNSDPGVGIPAATGEAPTQSAAPDLTGKGGQPGTIADQGMQTVGEVEKSISNTANGSTPAAGALGENAPEEDPEMAAANIADQKVKLNEVLIANGTNPQKALEQLRDQNLARYKLLEKEGAITKEFHTKLKDRWKNIFNVIPKEDFGMVLMDFGMRAMMAGETMGSMAALGAAGSGALAGVAQRKEQDYQRGISQEKMAGEEARADMNTATAAAAESKKLPETYDTRQGKFKVDKDGNLIALTDPKTGERLIDASAENRSVKSWEVDEWKRRFPGMTEQDVWLATASGLTPQMAYDRAQGKFDQWYNSSSTSKRSTLRINGKDVRKDQLTDEQIEAWKLERVRGYGYSEGALPSSGGGGEGGALPSDSGGGYEWKTTKPDGWTTKQWDDYEAERKAQQGGK